jgi:hypothetical protein
MGVRTKDLINLELHKLSKTRGIKHQLKKKQKQWYKAGEEEEVKY